MPGRSLLLPMLILAAGIHVALLAMPLPSTEAIKEPEDKRNPITVNQIPTEQPAEATSPPPGTVDVPELAANPPSASATSAADSAAADETAVETNASEHSAASGAPDSEPPTSSATSPATPNPATSKAATTPSATDVAAGSTGPIAPEHTSNAETTENTTPEAATAPTSVNPFAAFPHFQPSEADCYGLGFGENCRIVASQDLTQVAEFFKQELAAKDFTTTVVTDTADRKVFKVAKGEQTMFLNIWKGQNSISYLLSRVILKQSPEEIKVEAKQ